MAQRFKAIYFPRNLTTDSQPKTLTLAFSEQDVSIYERVRRLSSHEVRLLMSYQVFEELSRAAREEGLPLNAFCMRLLRERFENSTNQNARQLSMPNFELNEIIELDPIQATFKGGAAEPLHMWYPFLEGYSPKFVQTIINTYASEANIIFDPFAGTGTTPITGMKNNLQSYYCELNPLLQFLIEAKILAYKSDKNEREILAKELHALASQWNAMVRRAEPDYHLEMSYTHVFDKSIYFDPETFIQVLKSRSVIDKLFIVNQSLAKLTEIGVLASLLSSSKLIRSGDIRYRKGKEISRITPINDEVSRRLLMIANDLERIETPKNGYPVFLCEDARHLERLPALSFDAVITSPPYLNGTNYFRNTKIELWFLRCLQSSEDLASYRYKAVTSGINHVTVKKSNTNTPSVVNDIVETLEHHAYDSRIPRMAAGYFSDISKIFEGLRRHLHEGSKVAIDIGDSVYAGVHIPVQQLMASILEGQGYKLIDEVILRKRLSRDRTELSQVLLVFDYKGESESQRPSFKPNWSSAWDTFKSDLPYKIQPYAKRNWGHPLHSLCSYQGKMKPSLAHFLVKTFVSDGGTMLDPFAGVGTIPFEASLQGKMGYGFEISPAALVISRGKVESAIAEECDSTIIRLERFIEENEPTVEDHQSAQSVKFNGAIPDYYHPDTLKQILLARRYFINNPPISASECLVLACLLHILHGNRPYALSRRSHPITPFKPSGSFEYKSLPIKLRDKVGRSLSARKPVSYVEGKIFNQDATVWWPQSVTDIDAIITSPPFFNSTRFHVGNWIRLWFCGWEKQDFQEKPLAFVDERQKSTFRIYEPIFRQARERLKPAGVLVFHLGESKKCNMAEELSLIARPWFKTRDIFSEDVTNLERHGISDKGGVTKHQFLVLS